MIAELEDYLKLNNFVFDKSKLDVDSVYDFLKIKKSLSKYKLNFITLLAYFIIKNYDQSLKIGLLKDKQTLNPIVSIVLVKQRDGDRVFFNLENNIFGRSGSFRIEGLVNSLAEFKQRPDNIIQVIDKVFD